MRVEQPVFLIGEEGLRLANSRIRPLAVRTPTLQGASQLASDPCDNARMPIAPIGQSPRVIVVDKCGRGFGFAGHCGFHCCDTPLIFGICCGVGCRDDVCAVSMDQFLYGGSQNAPWAHLFLNLAQPHLGRLDLEADDASLEVGHFRVFIGELNPDIDASVRCSLVTSPCHCYRRDFGVSQTGDAQTSNEASKIGVRQVCDISGGDFEKLLSAWRWQLAFLRTSSSGLSAGHLEVAAIFKRAHMLLCRTSRREPTGGSNLVKRGRAPICLHSALYESQNLAPAVIRFAHREQMYSSMRTFVHFFQKTCKLRRGVMCHRGLVDAGRSAAIHGTANRVAGPAPSSHTDSRP